MTGVHHYSLETCEANSGFAGLVLAEDCNSMSAFAPVADANEQLTAAVTRRIADRWNDIPP
ncbi:hypothetical protein [Parasphingorhabdus sp.]|uniref:hypothetical protein n=1 Tax=Parasphingorhabdus sp. TaxID=2709688 RepID=UPI0032998849